MGGVELLHTFFTSDLDRGECSASHFLLLYHLEKETVPTEPEAWLLQPESFTEKEKCCNLVSSGTTLSSVDLVTVRT
jgi:hypothetical protein